MAKVIFGNDVVLLDPEDLWLLEHNGFSQWSVRTNNGMRYVGRKPVPGSSDKTYESLHRLIADCPEGMMVDHINGNTLDNRRSNLRVCTHAENMRNRKIHKNNKSGFKGVYLDRITGKWKAQIRNNRKRFYLGSYETPEEASKAYLDAAERLHGEFFRAA